jgi:AraC-like DNA-binding protein
MPMMFQLPEAFQNQDTEKNLIPLHHRKLQLPFEDTHITYINGASGSFIHQYAKIDEYLYGEHYYEPLVNTNIHITVTEPMLLLYGMLAGDLILREPDGTIVSLTNKRVMRFLTPGLQYSSALEEGKKYLFVYISLSSSLVGRLADSYPLLNSKQQALPYSKFSKKAHKEIHKMKSWSIPGKASIIYYTSRISDFVLSYLEEINREHRMTNSIVIHVNEFMADIDQFPERQINVIQQAQKMGMTARTLEKAFKTKKGITVLLYIQQQRIEKAKFLILRTGASIAKISFDVGYTDHSYFSRVFKRSTGKTPWEYRKGA